MSPAPCGASGTRPGDIVHIAYGYRSFFFFLKPAGLGAHYGAERLAARLVPVSGGMTTRQVTLIEDFAATTIMVTPSYMLSSSTNTGPRGSIPFRNSPLQGRHFSEAEPWTNCHCAQRSKTPYDMHAVGILQPSEVIGPGVAKQCVDTKDGSMSGKRPFLKIPKNHRPRDGRGSARWRAGGGVGRGGAELVFLARSLTPRKRFTIVSRYRTRDLTPAFGPGTARTHLRR